MNNADFPPADDGGGHVEQRNVVGSLLLVAHQDFAEAVKPRMAGFHNPTASTISWPFFLGRHFFSPLLHMRNVVPIQHALPRGSSRIALVRAEMLWAAGRWAGPNDDDAIEHPLQLRDIMPVCSADDDGERDATLVDKDIALAAFFSPDPWGLAPRPPAPGAP